MDATYAVGDVSDANSLKAALGAIREKAGHASMILYNAFKVEVKES